MCIRDSPFPGPRPANPARTAPEGQYLLTPGAILTENSCGTWVTARVDLAKNLRDERARGRGPGAGTRNTPKPPLRTVCLNAERMNSVEEIDADVAHPVSYTHLTSVPTTTSVRATTSVPTPVLRVHISPAGMSPAPTVPGTTSVPTPVLRVHISPAPTAPTTTGPTVTSPTAHVHATVTTTTTTTPRPRLRCV